MGSVDRDLQGHLGLQLIDAPQNELVRTLTRDIFDLEGPNLAQICILGSFCLGIYMGSVERDLQGHLGL